MLLISLAFPLLIALRVLCVLLVLIVLHVLLVLHRIMGITQLFPVGDFISDIIDSKDASASKNVVYKASNDSPAGLIQLK